MKTALVIAGAGAKILVEAGMAKAWEASGLKYDYLVGTSSGAITAACLHAGQIPELINFCLKVRNKDVFSLAPWKALGSEACFLDNAPLRKSLASILKCENIRANPVSCVVNATSLLTWSVQQYELGKLNDADMIEAILTSTAVPAAFPKKQGLVDGGVCDDYPVWQGLADNVDRVVVFIPSTKECADQSGVKNLVMSLFSIMIYNQLEDVLRAISLMKTNTEFVFVQPPAPVNIGLLDFDGLGTPTQRAAYIEYGFQLAAEKLQKLSR
jgi:predicted acylesterase/phospholipase RssA